ncbi:MAG: hypothetical protein ABSH52_28535 [Terriglobia bacterium]|jgi:hypothetical protein
MLQSCLLGLALLLLGLHPQQLPPLTTNASPRLPEEHSLPIDRPAVVTASSHARIDVVRLARDANELAKLANDIPSLIEQANNGLLPKDLNARLKRIEKLSKQIRRELTPVSVPAGAPNP